MRGISSAQMLRLYMCTIAADILNVYNWMSIRKSTGFDGRLSCHSTSFAISIPMNTLITAIDWGRPISQSNIKSTLAQLEDPNPGAA